jgi:DNA-binding IclR family transcriptional regulator
MNPATAAARPALTERQAQILGFLRGYHERHQHPASLTAICEAFGIAKPSAHRLRKELWLKGYLRKHQQWYVPV